MSVPIDLLRWAGTWTVSVTYSQYAVVQSPVDLSIYIYVGVPDITGGTDPSVPNVVWLLYSSGGGGGGGITSLNGLTDPAMSITSTDASVTITPVAPNSVDLSVGAFPSAYGSFSSTITTPLNPGSETFVLLTTIDVIPLAGLTFILPSSQVGVDNTGIYKCLASVQLDKTSPGLAVIDMYPKVNGTAVPNSATKLNINQNQEDVMTVEWFFSLSAGDNIAIALYTTSSGVRALAVPAAAPIPAIPSIILTIVRIA